MAGEEHAMSEADEGDTLTGVIVGIGASAGGLEALEELLSTAPSRSGIAYVVVQHLERHHPSALTEILSRFTPMPVREVVDGDRIEPGGVWVIPPDATLTLDGEVLRIGKPDGAAPRMVIDTLFRSLAEQRGELAVGILLSGADHDGTFGLRAIKEHAGLTLAQAPETARFPSMPQNAIDAGFVDDVLPVGAMADRLLAHFRALSSRDKTEDWEAEVRDALPRICEALRGRTGHDFSRYKEGTLVRRVRRRIQVHRIAHVAGYLDRLEQDPAEAGLLLQDLLIGVTQFFRDPASFDSLADRVLPQIFADPSADRPIRIWVPGCATGEEAYSIGMLVRERSRGDRARPVQIFATDIDEQALATGRAGRYREEIAEQVGPERLQRFFVRDQAGYRINEELRSVCVFSAHSLIRDPPFSTLDLISCRNLLIYMKPELQRRVMPLFHYALRRSGFLFLGPSEELAGHDDLFAPIEKKHGVFQRRDTLVRPPLDLPLSGARAAAAVPRAVAPDSPARNMKQLVQLSFERMILEEIAPASAVVDERGEIVCVAGRFGELFKPRPGVLTTNILDYAAGSLRHALRRTLGEAAARGTTVRAEVAPVQEDAPRLRLTARPAPGAPPRSGLLALIVEEITGPQPEASAVEEARAVEPVIEQLETELMTTRADLQAAVEELESTNEELKSSNEELISTNEELQSANEELQTSKEELQSVNEELETMNGELRQMVHDLGTANSDLQNLFASTEIATVFLDRDLRLEKFTPAATALFSFIESDVGRPLADLAPRFAGLDLIASVREVLSTLQPIEREAQAHDAWFIVRVFPYRTLDDRVAGAVVTFSNVTNLKRAELQIVTILESITDAFYSVDRDWRFTYVNRRAATLWGMEPESLIGRVLWDVFPHARGNSSSENLLRAMSARVEVQYEAYSRLVDQWLRINLYPSAQGLSVYFQDITARKKTEDALVEADQRKTEFLAILSHELRNPLAPIKNSLGILERVPPGSDQARRALDVIARQVRQLSHLVGDLLDVTRVARDKIQLQRERLDLGDLLRRTVEDYRSLFEERGVRVDLDLRGGPVLVRADAIRLSQVIGNLLQNAVKFTGYGGSARVTLSADHDGSHALLRVEDTGAGMSDETIARLFQPFMQADATLDRSQGGLGLGLALVKGLVELHGGEVSARSAGLGHGTEVTVRLPLDDTPAEVAGPLSSEQAAPSARFRVLIVEDNTDAADTLHDVLELSGHEVRVAYDGPSGLSAARESPPDVILCDIGLPGLSGYEVARALRADKALAGTALVALTGYARPEDIRKATEAGFDRHLSKPPSIEKLEALLASLRRE